MCTAQEAKQFWDDRYSSENNIYSTQPNRFITGQVDNDSGGLQDLDMLYDLDELP